MERRVNLRSAGHADALGDCLAKLFRDAADDAFASDKGRKRRKSAARHSRHFHPFAPCSRHCSAPNVGVALSSDVSTGDASACPDRARDAANVRSNESRFAPQPIITAAGKITNHPRIGNKEANPSATPPRNVARHGCCGSIFPEGPANLSPTTVTNPATPQFAIIRYRQTVATAAIFPAGPKLPNTAAAKIITAAPGNPARKGLINPSPQTAAALATARGHSPRHNTHNPGRANNSPRITKKIAIVSAISMANPSHYILIDIVSDLTLW
jgi:hypothetical protein